MTTKLLDQAVQAHQAGHLTEAEKLYRDVLASSPQQPDALALFGVLLSSKGNHTAAVGLIEQAAQLDPTAPLFKFYLGSALMAAGEPKRALPLLQEVVQDQPNFGEAWKNLARVAEEVGEYQLSIAAGAHAITLLPNDAMAHCTYGVALNWLEQHEMALGTYQIALRLSPESLQIRKNIAMSYQYMNRLEEVAAVYHDIIARAGQTITDEDNRRVDENEYGNWHWQLALLELLQGDFKHGFARYRARFKEINWLQRVSLPRPLWQGEDLSGKTILINDEQGFGDCLMFCRYLPLLKQRGARVKFIVHPMLVPLFQGWSGADEVAARDQTVALDFDYHCSVLDLPYLFGTVLETVPADVPYLPMLPPNEATELPNGPGLKVGVVWGGAMVNQQLRRSVPLEIFADMFVEKGIQFFSLNRDKRSGDDDLLKKHPVIDLALRLNDFSDTARFMGQMDLIITCDTSTAHLAGGMGKPVWTLLPFTPDWRYLMDRPDCVWYPTMRLFRQPKRGDWNSVIRQVRAVLQDMI